MSSNFGDAFCFTSTRMLEYNLTRRTVFKFYHKKCNLIFFWPCIMNWLYINYQLDALIIIYYFNNNQCIKLVTYSRKKCVGRDSSVGTATRYGLDGPGIESLWGARYFEPVLTRPVAHPASYTTDNCSFPWVKRPERAVDHPPHLTSSLKKEYSYISSPSLGSWPVVGWPLPFP